MITQKMLVHLKINFKEFPFNISINNRKIRTANYKNNNHYFLLHKL